MAKYSLPDKFIAIVMLFHEGMLARVLDKGESSETCDVTNGVKQGCVLVPTLFSMVFSARPKIAFQDNTDSMAIRYRTDGEPFNLKRLQTRTKVEEIECVTFCFLTIVLQMPVQKMRCRTTYEFIRLTAMPLNSPPAQSKLRSCFSHHPTQIQPSQSSIKNCKQ